MAWLASTSSAMQVHELILQRLGRLCGKHPCLPFLWYLYLGRVKRQLVINCHWGERMWWRNWADLESCLGFPAAGLVWAVRKSDGIPFRNLTLDCPRAAFQELSRWQNASLRVTQIQARPCLRENGFSFKTCASSFGISLKNKNKILPVSEKWRNINHFASSLLIWCFVLPCSPIWTSKYSLYGTNRSWCDFG